MYTILRVADEPLTWTVNRKLEIDACHEINNNNNGTLDSINPVRKDISFIKCWNVCEFKYNCIQIIPINK